MPRRLVILNGADDARHYLHNRQLDDFVVSAHGSAKMLLTKSGIECKDLDGQYSYEELFQWERDISARLESFLLEWDKKFSAEVTGLLGVEAFDFFQGCYSYTLFNLWLGIHKFSMAIRRTIQQTGVDVILHFSNQCRPDQTMVLALRHVRGFMDAGVDFQQLTYREPQPTVSLADKWRRIQHKPSLVWEALSSLLRGADLRIDTDHVLVVGEPYHILDMLSRLYPGLRVVHILARNSPKPESHLIPGEALERLKKLLEPAPSGVSLEALAMAMIITDLEAQFANLTSHLRLAKQGMDKGTLRCLLWGNSPVATTKAAVVQYVKSRGLPVIGMQHGSHYGIINLHRQHHYSDFMHCTEFLTYGFTATDIEKTYGPHFTSCQFRPVGRPAHTQKTRKAKKVIDVLYVPTNSLSLLDDGTRMKQGELSKIQAEILEKLSQLNGCKVAIKPFMFFNEENFCLIHALNEYSGIEVLRAITFEEVLQTFEVRAVVFDMFSTPAYECINTNVEIFCIDEVRPWNKYLHKNITGRIFLEGDAHKLLEMTKSWLNNQTTGKSPEAKIINPSLMFSCKIKRQ